jgi:hypothetical protein
VYRATALPANQNVTEVDCADPQGNTMTCSYYCEGDGCCNGEPCKASA